MRHLITLDDLSNFEISQIFRLADQMRTNLATWSGFCQGKLLATLFYEPSTRTRLSFESAMERLNGRTLGFADPHAASVAKGETIADTARMVTNYADVIVVRHSFAGSARVMARYANIPVINGGDGSHAHPTQALADMYTVIARKGEVKGLTVGICGDLRYGRAAHSFALAIARFGGKLVHIAPEGFQMPKWVLTKIRYLYGGAPAVSLHLADVIRELDVIYVNRLQEERLPADVDPETARSSYLVNADVMRNAKSDAMIMHPLPRVNELSYELDEDPRAAYFEQSANAIPTRMALIASLTGLEELILTQPPGREITGGGEPCANPDCVTAFENYLQPEIETREGEGSMTSCAYCGVIVS
ncbi:MAG: aspartate carbamoyltransferase [Candidatus Poribacteria bacterium]|nr:aspartate carbamoyltransferase [Candidatus Poribacteria bacterium]MDE0505809.1 aspartate carbamoyltransferase [Candidatus Poribacteria bacterium]